MNTRLSKLDKTAKKMTEIIQDALDKFPPAERAKRLKAYLSGDFTAVLSDSVGPAGTPSTRRGSARTPAYRVAARSR